MHYSDIASLPMVRAAHVIADHYTMVYPVARAIVQACRDAHNAGCNGRDYVRPIASRDLTDLVKGAWHDGIVGRKLVVKLTSRECSECTWTSCRRDGNPDPNCEYCNGTGRDCCVMAEVSAPYADDWADWDQSIAGDSWETPGDMPHFAYAMPVDHPGLVAELRVEGYTLDLSEYES